MMRSTADRYYASIREEAPRVLGLMDRDLLSRTAGCCDRSYWAWKFVDFPGARFQEAVCVLSFLYAVKREDNPFAGSGRLLEWISDGLRFWTRIQHADGSFDEAYPFERSLAATAFTSFYVGEAVEFLSGELPGDAAAAVRRALSRAGRWLVRREESHGFLSNHVAAAAAALYHIYRITGEEVFDARSRYFVERILERQSREGWYEEYGGADPGYQTHGSFYLARYWALSKNEVVAESLSRATRFLAHFVHADGSLGGEYASRNTQTYYPAAFEMLAARDRVAAWIAERARPSVWDGAAVGPRSVDAYNYFPFLNNLVFAYLACADSGRVVAEPEEPSPAPGMVWFREAGLVRVRRDRYDAYLGASKGGVLKVFDRVERKLVYSDCGYIGRLRDGRLVSTQYQDANRIVRVGPDRIEIEGGCCDVGRPIMTPGKFVLFRLFMLSCGRVAVVGRWLKERLVRALVYRKRHLRIGFRRAIEFGEERVRVSDEISGPDCGRLEALRWGEAFTTIHMGSSRYFVNNELNGSDVSSEMGPGDLDSRQLARGVTLERTVTFPAEKA